MPSKIIIYIIIAAVVTTLGAAVYFMVFTGAFRFASETAEPKSRAVLPKLIPDEKEPELPITAEPVIEISIEPAISNLPPEPKISPPPTKPAPKIVPEDTKPKPKPKLHVVFVKDDHFDPRIITINIGDTVRWINNGTKLYWPSADPHPTHSALPEFDPLADLSPGESYDFTFTQVGVIPYHDHTQAVIDDVATITGTVVILAPQ